MAQKGNKSVTPAAPLPQQFQYQQLTIRSALPPAQELERLEKLNPGITERYLKQWEKQTEHRQKLESHAIAGQEKRSSRGQVFAFILGSIALLGGFGLIAIGKDGVGIAAIIGAVGTLLTAFFAGMVREYLERKSKRDAMAKKDNR